MTSATMEAPQPLGPPTREDGSLYLYEMVYAGMTRRAYEDTPEALMAHLIPGYLTMGEKARWQARLGLAVKAQVQVQAIVNTMDSFHTLTEDQQAILQGPRHEPPVVATWECPVPLVLVASFYRPAGTAPRPVSNNGMEPNVIWINPSDDLTLLESLHDLDVISLHMAL